MYGATPTRNPLARRTHQVRGMILRGLGDGVVVNPNNPEVPAGMQLTYIGTWQTTWTLRASEVAELVGDRLAKSGLPVRSQNIEKSSWLSDVLISPQEFYITLTLQATGGYEKVDHVINVIRHWVYEVTGMYPLSNSISSVGGQSTGQPGSPKPPAPGLTDWLGENAGIIGIVAAAALLGTVVVKKL